MADSPTPMLFNIYPNHAVQEAINRIDIEIRNVLEARNGTVMSRKCMKHLKEKE